MDARVEYSLAFYADVARRAAAEADGVVGTARDPLLGLIGRVGRGYSRGGVRVYAEADGGVCMDVNIVVSFGSNLKDAVRRAHESIVQRVSGMSGTVPRRVVVAVKGVSERRGIERTEG